MLDTYLWAVYALGSALAWAIMLTVSEYYKQSGVGFVAVIRSCTALTLLPFVFFVEWPTEPLFYIYGAIPYLMFAYADILLFHVNAKYGAGVITRFLPLTAIIAFLIWLVVDSDTVQSYLESPIVAIGVFGCLLGVVASMSFIRKCSVNVAAFKILLPALILMPIGGTFVKLAFDQTDLTSGPLIALFIGSLVAISTYGLLYLVIPSVKQNCVMTKITVKAGMIASVFSTLLIYFFNVSADLVSNPAYSTSVSFTSAIWVLVIYKIIGRRDDARVLPGLGIVFFAMLLVFLSGQI